MKPHKDAHFPNVADITCMDPSHPPIVADKACKTVRLIAFLIQNGVSKTNVQDVMKRGKSIGKALNTAVARHHDSLTCRSRDSSLSFVSPLEYQFSCSGSPPRPSHAGRRRMSPAAVAHVRRGQDGRGGGPESPPAHRVAARMCRGESDALAGHYRPVGRRVKITAVESAEKEFHVDEAAEEFIERFYRELRLQKWLDHYC